MPTTDYKKLQKQLSYNRQNAWEVMSSKDKKEAMQFSEDYKIFLDKSKTEFEAVQSGLSMAQANGFKDLKTCHKLKPGDKIYAINRDKNIMLVVLGKNFLNKGANFIMSHVDSPHLDLKVNPLYEDSSIAYLKTHYYGGIKKYQWPTIPLALHGVIYLSNGKQKKIVIGENTDDPIFMITDLLPHLGHDQLKKTLADGIAGEELNIVIGSIPVQDKNIKERVKLALLEHLYKNYGIKEHDFVSADIQAVSASKARDLGFDRSFVAAFGHDDRVCAYSSIRAILDSSLAERTQICLWTDREEIGSEGNTGAQSIWLESVLMEILDKSGQVNSASSVNKALERSQAISADVTAAFDPDYKEVHDPKNSAYIGCGVAIEKYTGHRGKYSTSEASSAYMYTMRNMLDKAKIVWQSGGLGKVDQGGGGTIAMYLARRNMDVVDMGIGVLNMHAPIEIVSKADILQAYKAYSKFFVLS